MAIPDPAGTADADMLNDAAEGQQQDALAVPTDDAEPTPEESAQAQPLYPS